MPRRSPLPTRPRRFRTRGPAPRKGPPSRPLIRKPRSTPNTGLVRVSPIRSTRVRLGHRLNRTSQFRLRVSKARKPRTVGMLPGRPVRDQAPSPVNATRVKAATPRSVRERTVPLLYRRVYHPFHTKVNRAMSLGLMEMGQRFHRPLQLRAIGLVTPLNPLRKRSPKTTSPARQRRGKTKTLAGSRQAPTRRR